jgi:hypothetical protein
MFLSKSTFVYCIFASRQVRPFHFTPGKRTPGTLWVGGWVYLITGLETVKKRKKN